ncbi:DUF4118 domain-containing protein [Microbispora sp. ZYX-F-249]|uniref:histidine kinase n=1 Tax=Microbispora maris TaxID=3144104 RepID=A0ABV0AFZ0_9ACTN
MRTRLSPLLPARRPPWPLGILVSALCVVAETLLTLWLGHVAPGNSLGVVYLLGVLAVSYGWGPVLGVATALASGLAYDFFHVPPLHRVTPFGDLSWPSILIFLVVALLVSAAASLLRSLVLEAEERLGEADLDAAVARALLGTAHLRSALPTAARRLAEGLGLPGLSIEAGEVAGDGDHTALPLRKDGERLGTLVVPAGLDEAMTRRLRRRVVPSLEALLLAAAERERVGRALEASRDELCRVVTEQAALRRVATLVAYGLSSVEVFDAVTAEMGRVLNADYALIERYSPDGTMILVSAWSGRRSDPRPDRDAARPMRAGSISDLVLRTGRPCRLEAGQGRPPGLAAWAPDPGISCALGAPITVEGRLWGVMVALFRTGFAAVSGVERRMTNFTELLGTAISNAQARDDLAASRARVVVASDEVRHRIERDLHDGVQQRLVSLALELRSARAAVPPELTDVRWRLSRTADDLNLVLDDLRELSRGIHPAILSKGGLGPALKMLARRSAVPVELRIRTDRRLPERVEVAAYYVVSEALTNVAKHAGAGVVRVEAETDDGGLRISVRDDGVGGADSGRGSGLIGLRDRVEALGGRMEIDSPVGGGTRLTAVIPVPARAEAA